MGSGAKGGLDILLNGIEKDFDDLCRGPVQGFKVKICAHIVFKLKELHCPVCAYFQLVLHTPGEVPQVAKQFFRIPFGQEVLIAIKPKIITTSDGLKHYEPNRYVLGQFMIFD